MGLALVSKAKLVLLVPQRDSLAVASSQSSLLRKW